MDIFSTVASAITVAEGVWKLIDGHRKAPERLRRLQFDLQSLRLILERLQAIDSLSSTQRSILQPDITEIERILQEILQSISKLTAKKKEHIFSRSVSSLRMQFSFSDLDELARELQKRKASLTLAVNTVSLSVINGIDVAKPTISYEMASTNGGSCVHDIGSITAREFLEVLNAPNYIDDKFRVKEPAEGTGSWIYDRPEYAEWHNTEERLASLHIVGKMGSGKSVLMKSILKSLQSQAGNLQTHESGVLYFFCTCIDRTDTPKSILKALIVQLINNYPGLFEKAVPDIEIFQGQQSPGSINWSLGAMWHVFITLLQHVSFSTLYCVIDALDECELAGLDDLLQRLLNLSKNPSSSGIMVTTRLLFSSREHSHILTLLDTGETCLRVFIRPSCVEPDIRVAMQSDFCTLKKLLDLSSEETEKLQETLLKKSDGMFVWVFLAMKEIACNCHHATYEDLEGLINDLPVELKGLYEKSWAKLIQSLSTKQIELAKRVLVWILLAKRPLTITELTVALAINPGEKTIPHRNKLLRSLPDFIRGSLTPFVEISEMDITQIQPANATGSTDSNPFVPIGPRVRLVHQSAQEYLLDVCDRGDGGQSSPGLSIDLRDGHATIALVCISYLKCEELQLGWIGLEDRHPDGGQIVTEETREEVRKRLETYTLLEYAARYSYYHVRQLQSVPYSKEYTGGPELRKKDYDIVQQALDFILKYRRGYECAVQVLQFMSAWDSKLHDGPPPPISAAVGLGVPAMVRSLLDDPATDIFEREKAYGNLPLHYAAAMATKTTHLGEFVRIVEMLLEKGADINYINITGCTPLHIACHHQLHEVVKILLEKGADASIKNKRGETPLNMACTLKSHKTVEMLMEAGSDCETHDNLGYQPIVRAATVSSWETVRLLLRHGVNPRSHLKDGYTCLHAASRSGETHIMEQLLDAGVPADITMDGGWTPLHISVRYNQLEATQLLLARGASPAAPRDDGYLPLHTAATFSCPRLLGLLLSNQLDLEILLEAGPEPVICCAIRGEFPQNISLLIERGANKDVRCDTDGLTPLHIAAICDRLDAIKILLGHGADINSVTDYGHDVLTTATGGSSFEAVRILVDNNASVDGCSNMGVMTPLHMAAYDGKTKVVEFLLQKGAIIDRCGPEGLTPLAISVSKGHLEISDLLVMKGAK
ncbi:hypothetical protein MaudCBS49596_000440 [Microsporum audouinii]